MKKLKGFTLIELIIVITIIGIIAAIFSPSITGSGSWFSPTKCINGYLFVDNGMGGYNQVMDANGGGAVCTPPDSKPKL